jgi:colanic acid/amylovoran biosynthesis glycosyltransferase
VKRWLEPTNTWIHSQIAQQTRWRAIVLAERVRAPERFPTHELHALVRLPLAARGLNRALLYVTGRAPYHERALRHAGARVIHAHYGHGGWRALPLARATRVPLVTTFYGADLSLFPQREPAWHDRYARLFEHGELFLLEGPHMREQLVALGCPPDKAVVQHLGVDTRRLEFRERAPDDDGTVRVLVCGRFAEKKGMPDAVEAFARAHAERPELRLTIIGDAGRRAAEQQQKRQILDAIRRHRLHDVITLAGAVTYDALIEAYATHHILLAPSVTARDGDTEGGAPVVVTEALATGMPVVATRHADIPHVVADGVSGFLAAERDVDALGAALARLGAEPERWPAMGRAARARIEAEFNAKVQADRLAAWYERAAGMPAADR